MNHRALAVLAVAALAAALAWRAATAPPAGSALRHPPPAPAAIPPPDGTGRAANPVVAAEAAPARALRVALARAFRGAPLPEHLAARLAGGDVDGVIAELSASPAPESAARLWDLARLCTAAPVSGAAPRAGLEPLAAAAAAWQARISAACAANPPDHAALARRLAAAAASGDAASLARLAEVDPMPAARLASAAMLGDAGAQLRLGLDALAAQPDAARTWLEGAARGDADAAAILGACLASGCFGSADPAAARAALESAARRGAPYALGLLAGASGEALHGWLPADTPLSPLPPADGPPLLTGAAERYAWARRAARLASAGCFGFDLGVAAAALDWQARLDRALSPAELAAGRAAVDRDGIAGCD